MSTMHDMNPPPYEQGYERGYNKGFADGQPKWISVKDRLPELPGAYLVFFHRDGKPVHDDEWSWRRNVTEHEGFWTEVCQRWWSGRCWAGYEETVTHWMPLPEPPQEGD